MAYPLPVRIADYQLRDQVSGIIIDHHNFERDAAEMEVLHLQDEAFLKAMDQIDNVRWFVGSPEHILGNPDTKHGEIAEHLEVGVRNAREVIEQQAMKCTFDGIPRTGPEDYKDGTLFVQQKFINGANNSLRHVLGHMEDYPNFTTNGNYYHIPKDQFEIVQRIASGEDIPGLNRRSQNAILEKIEEISETTGKSFEEAVHPSVLTYAEVQQGRIHQTIDNHEDLLVQRNTEINSEISADHDPSIFDSLGPTGVAACVGGAVSFTSILYSKYRDGKNPFTGDFTSKDWKEIGLSTTKGVGGGAVAGTGIYLLTNYADLSAPFAGAIVSGVKGIAALSQQHRDGNITQVQFVQMGFITCAESACVGISTTIGQAVIPIPVLGSVIGSVAGKMLVEISRDFRLSKEIQDRIRSEINAFLVQLDDETRAIIKVINKQYDQLSDLLSAAFDSRINSNLLLSRSVCVAEVFGGKDPILRRVKDVEDYFLN